MVADFTTSQEPPPFALYHNPTRTIAAETSTCEYYHFCNIIQGAVGPCIFGIQTSTDKNRKCIYWP
jgi:hypothetical protein